MNAVLPVWLIFGGLICWTISALGSGNERQSNIVRKDGSRLAKFDADFWTPRNVSEDLKTQTSALEIYAQENLNEKIIENELLPKNSNSVTKEIARNESLGRKLEDSDEESEDVEYEARHLKQKFKKKHKKKKKKKKYTNTIKIRKTYKKMMMPLLIAYKLKFFTLIPVLIAGVLLLAKTAGLAGFFFALFSTVMALKGRLS